MSTNGAKIAVKNEKWVVVASIVPSTMSWLVSSGSHGPSADVGGDDNDDAVSGHLAGGDTDLYRPNGFLRSVDTVDDARGPVPDVRRCACQLDAA